MAHLYLDNDVSLRIAPLLRNAGHFVSSTRDLAFQRATDDAQLLTATQNAWILVTYNRRDFTLLHDAWQTWPAAFGLALPAHSGIFVLGHAPPEAQSMAIAGLLATVPTVSFANEIFWWHRHHGWRCRVIEAGWEPFP